MEAPRSHVRDTKGRQLSARRERFRTIQAVKAMQNHVSETRTIDVPDSSRDSESAFDNTGSLTTEDWMTTDQAAQYLNLSAGSLRNMSSSGQIPYYKLG